LICENPLLAFQITTVDARFLERIQMLTRNDLVRFHGTVQQVNLQEKLSATSIRGGGYIANGSGFIAPSSISIQSHARQEFWLKGPAGERNFQIPGEGLPMRDGQKITVLWLKDHMVAFVNHATSHFLLLEKELSTMAGGKPKPTYLYALIPFMIIFFLLAGFMGQMGTRAGHAWAQTWGGLTFLTLLGALFVVPMVGLFVGVVRNRAYRARHAAAKSLVKHELDFLLSRNLSL
jgi:hypothetical protein